MSFANGQLDSMQEVHVSFRKQDTLNGKNIFYINYCIMYVIIVAKI